MTERKVLNRYYPPDYDPSKIPRLPKDSKQAKRSKIFEIRVMAPFNMRCNSCSHYIYKATKFNSRTEEAGTGYLGLHVRRFYIKCPNCISEITFKTDPGNIDYAMEYGATRCFDSLRLAAKQEDDVQKAEEEELEINPMKALEKRTAQSQREMDNLQALEELREIQRRHAKLDHNSLLDLHHNREQAEISAEEAEDDLEVQKYFGSGEQAGPTIRRVSEQEGDETAPSTKQLKLDPVKRELAEKKSNSFASKRGLLAGLIKPKAAASSSTSTTETVLKPKGGGGALSSLAGYNSGSDDSE